MTILDAAAILVIFSLFCAVLLAWLIERDAREWDYDHGEDEQ